MGKGGEIASPLPSRMAVSSSAEIDKTDAVGASVRRHLPAGTIAEDELRLPVNEVLLVVTIEAESRVLRDFRREMRARRRRRVSCFNQKVAQLSLPATHASGRVRVQKCSTTEITT